MRDITIREVHLGCLACDCEKSVSNEATGFIAGVLTGMVKDELPLCSGHYRAFKNAMNKVVAADVEPKRPLVLAPVKP